MTDFSRLDINDSVTNNKPQIDWRFYLHQGEMCTAVWVDLLKENIDALCAYYSQAVEVSRSLANNTVISHRNLDSRNVLWLDQSPFIVDWEDAGLINPMYDFVNTAVNWAKTETGEIVKERFFTFADSYKKKRGVLQANWRTVLTKRLIEPLD